MRRNIPLEKIDEKEDPADLNTKHVNSKAMKKDAVYLGLQFREGLPEATAH